LKPSREKHGQDWIRTEANFGRIRTGLDCNFFENWRIGTGSDWENFVVWCDYSNRIKNFSCNVILEICQKVCPVYILPSITKALLRLSVEHDLVSGSRSNRILKFRTGFESDRISKKTQQHQIWISKLHWSLQ